MTAARLTRLAAIDGRSAYRHPAGWVIVHRGRDWWTVYSSEAGARALDYPSYEGDRLGECRHWADEAERL